MAISVDEIEGAATTDASYSVPFPLLSDPDASVHEAYRVVNQLDEAGVSRLKGFGIDVERWSKRKHHKIAIPSLFLVGKDGKVKFAHAARDYKTRPATAALLSALEKVQAK